MATPGFHQVPVTEWIEDNEQTFPTSFGDLCNREWLQREMRRIGSRAPYSDPVIRTHPRYFDKDSHGRRKYRLIALFRCINPAELDEAHNRRKDRTITGTRCP